MKFIQYYLDCLSHASYLIGDETTGQAVVVDPRRDVGQYISGASAMGLDIELVIETHFHADFVSGHLELAAATGASIAYSSVAQPHFEHEGVGDGQRYSLGDVTLEFRHTPGHTPESMCVVVYEHLDDTVPYGVLTGDTLFIGDVGRPDLLASSGSTREELAGKLYDSLHDTLMTLPDATRVYPAHGAGSACGRNLSTESWSTIGAQRQSNYALQAPDKPSFIDLVTQGQLPAPGYFGYDALLNRTDRRLLDESAMPTAMSYAQAVDAVAEGAVVIDGRDPEEFARGHLRGAVNVGLSGRFAQFAGSVVEPDVDIVLVAAPGAAREGKNRLARIGFDRVIGFLADTDPIFAEHRDDVTSALRLTAMAFDEQLADDTGFQVVDVRNPGEAEAGIVPGAINIPLAQLPARISELESARPTVVYCAGGYRSSVAASLLRRHGFAAVSDIIGGYQAWARTVQTA